MDSGFGENGWIWDSCLKDKKNHLWLRLVEWKFHGAVLLVAHGLLIGGARLMRKPHEEKFPFRETNRETKEKNHVDASDQE